MQTIFSKQDHKFQIMPIQYQSIPGLMCEESIQYHYGKHHIGYVNKLNTLITNDYCSNLDLDDLQIDGLMKFAYQNMDSMQHIFNNAAQIYNHDFFWNGLSDKKIDIAQDLHIVFDQNFGSLDKFYSQFTQKALNHFGSGWCWLVKNQDNSLSIETTKDAYSPLLYDKKPLWNCDLWEHAYYIDYRNDRSTYISNIFQFINWNFVHKNFNI